MIKQKSNVLKNKDSDTNIIFALGSVRTLEEYLYQARLPEVFGVPARVVEILEKRIGRAPLSIGNVAEDLDISKRTLQRRLQQHDISFAEIRDQVRFYYSIRNLINPHQSIDSIVDALDFSDRTSFTNAFKRWTGLSPSTFRKLFLNYSNKVEYQNTNEVVIFKNTTKANFHMSFEQQLEALDKCDSEDFNDLLDAVGLPRDQEFFAIDASGVNIESKSSIISDFSKIDFKNKGASVQGVKVDSIEDVHRVLESIENKKQ